MAEGEAGHAIHLSNFVGSVDKIHPPDKAVVIFNYKGKKERALLFKSKLLIDGKGIPAWHKMCEIIHEGSVIKFSCHTFNDVGGNNCKWFISNAWRQHKFDLGSPIGKSTVNLMFGLYRANGLVKKVEPMTCVLSFTNGNGEDDKVLVLISKVYINGHQVTSEQSLKDLIKVNDSVMFDAVPCMPDENGGGCKWLATVMWTGHRPSSHCNISVEVPFTLDSSSLLEYIKQVSSDSKSAFLLGKGRIVSVLSEEYGVALIALRHNHWQSLLFHRIACFLFGLNLSTYDLQKVFKEGDQIKFIAVAAPCDKLMTQWLAIHMSVSVGTAIPKSELPPVKKLSLETQKKQIWEK